MRRIVEGEFADTMCYLRAYLGLLCPFRGFDSYLSVPFVRMLTALFLALDALDVDEHDGLIVRDAILGNEVGEYSVHFEGLPRDRG